MASSALLPVLFSSSLLLVLTNGATFTVTNQCSYTVWAAGSTMSPNVAPALSGGTQLNSGQTWTVDVSAGTKGGHIWGRTGCSFDSNGNGKCDTGDCGKLICNNYGSAPNTLAEFSLNQAYNLDYNDISLVDGFNVPMNYVPASGCSSAGSHCSADVNAYCPSELKKTGGCFNPCQVYKTYEYCCNPPGASSCEPTMYSEYFKNLCPQTYTYPNDTTLFTCPGGTNYNVVFCP